MIYLIKKLLIDPSVGLSFSLENKLLKDAFFFVVAYGVLTGLWGYFEIGTESKFNIIPFFSPVIFVAVWLIISFFLFLGSKRFKGKGSYKDTLIVFGCPFIIWTLVFLVFILFSLFGIRGGIPGNILQAVNILWFTIILIIGLKEAHKISTARVIGSLFITCFYFAIVVFFIGAIVYFI